MHRTVHFFEKNFVVRIKNVYLQSEIFSVYINMKTDTIDNNVVEFSNAVRSIEDIKASYPDEWIVIGNPEMDEYKGAILSGVVLYHSRDKRELAYRDKPLLKNYKTKSLFYNRVTPREKRPVIASIFSTLKPPKPKQ